MATPKTSTNKRAEKSAQLFYLVYRTGSPENCQWQRTEAFSKAQAESKSKAFEADGIKALIVDKKMSDVIGLPEGWEYKKSGKFANQCGEPFGLTFKERKFTNPDRDPKGVIQDCRGVDVHFIAERIREVTGGEYQPYSGRGTQFRANLAEAMRMVEAEQG